MKDSAKREKGHGKGKTAKISAAIFVCLMFGANGTDDSPSEKLLKLFDTHISLL